MTFFSKTLELLSARFTKGQIRNMRKMHEKAKKAQERKRKFLRLQNPAPVASFFRKPYWKHIVEGQKAKDLKNGVDQFGNPTKN
eukprot:gene8784-732_t